MIFNSLEEFNAWYRANREKFSLFIEDLDMLLTLESGLNVGCRRRRAKRRRVADNYYQDLFIKQPEISTEIKRIGEFENIEFKVSLDGVSFLIV